MTRLDTFKFVGRTQGGGRMFRNSEYTVTRHETDEQGLILLSLSRHLDRTSNVPWRDKQAIKNMIVGPEHEAVELFPAESRLNDAANEYWLYVIAKKGQQFPFGFKHGRVVSDREGFGSAQAPGSGATPKDEEMIAGAMKQIHPPQWAIDAEKQMDTAAWRLRRIHGWADLMARHLNVQSGSTQETSHEPS